MSSINMPVHGYQPAMSAPGVQPISLFTQGGIAACLLGVASGIPVQAVGRLYVGELILMVIAPVVALLLLGISNQYGKTARMILFAMIVSWIGYVISDLIRDTPSNDYLPAGLGGSRWERVSRR